MCFKAYQVFTCCLRPVSCCTRRLLISGRFRSIMRGFMELDDPVQSVYDESRLIVPLCNNVTW